MQINGANINRLFILERLHIPRCKNDKVAVSPVVSSGKPREYGGNNRNNAEYAYRNHPVSPFSILRTSSRIVQDRDDKSNRNDGIRTRSHTNPNRVCYRYTTFRKLRSTPVDL